MSQESHQTTTESSSNNNNNNRKKQTTWIFIGVIVLLLGVNIYLFISKNKVAGQRDEAYTQLDTVSADRDNVRSEFDAALARLDLLTTKNAQLDSLVNGKDSEIGRLRSQIQSILNNSRSTTNDLNRAKTLITQLNSKVKSYEEQIAELQGENSRLTDYNKLLAEERDSTVTTNIALQQKVRLGAVLHASNIRMSPIDLRRNGHKEKETSRAKKVDIFRISFDIDENRIAEDGTKDIYIRILDPNKNLLSNAAYGSGVSTTYDGSTLNYTLVKQINLKQAAPVKNITVDWHQDSDYDKGLYTIELYNEGYKIGSGTINLN